jgi:hypothetical protein
MMRPLRDDERDVAAAAMAVYLVEHAVEITAQYPTGTSFVPVAIDTDAQEFMAIVEEPAIAGAAAPSRTLAGIPMPAAA